MNRLDLRKSPHSPESPRGDLEVLFSGGSTPVGMVTSEKGILGSSGEFGGVEICVSRVNYRIPAGTPPELSPGATLPVSAAGIPCANPGAGGAIGKV